MRCEYAKHTACRLIQQWCKKHGDRESPTWEMSTERHTSGAFTVTLPKFINNIKKNAQNVF